MNATFDINEHVVPKKKERKLIAGQPIWLLGVVAGVIVAVISTVLGLYAHGTFDDEYQAAARQCEKSLGGVYRYVEPYEAQTEQFIDFRNRINPVRFIPNPDDAICVSEGHYVGWEYETPEEHKHFVFEVYPNGKKP